MVLRTKFCLSVVLQYLSWYRRSYDSIMVLSLIGDFLPLEKKGMAAGLAVGAVFVANLIMPQVTMQLATLKGGAKSFCGLSFHCPLSVALWLFVLPSKPLQEQSANKPQYLEAFKLILSNKSAIACVVACASLDLILSVLSTQ